MESFDLSECPSKPLGAFHFKYFRHNSDSLTIHRISPFFLRGRFEKFYLHPQLRLILKSGLFLLALSTIFAM